MTTKKAMAWILSALFTGFACSSPGTSEPERSSDKVVLADPLPSWNDGQLKQDIISFVKKVTDSSSPSYIPPADRIATFDNDGTLWAERPYVQELFAIHRVKEQVKANPTLAQSQPYKAIVEQDKGWFEKGGEKAMLQLVAVTHTGMSEESFDKSVADFFTTATYPGKNVSINKIVYQPQLELLDYLRRHGFKVFICTGGTVEFVRGISQQLYQVPPEQVIGTTFKYVFTDSTRSIMRLPSPDHINDKEGKPVAIQRHIGRRPVFACGNEGGEGDIAMLKFSQGNKYPSFQLLVNHDDSTREYYYQEKTNASLNAAAQNKWHVVSIRNDWKRVFPQ